MSLDVNSRAHPPACTAWSCDRTLTDHLRNSSFAITNAAVSSSATTSLGRDAPASMASPADRRHASKTLVNRRHDHAKDEFNRRTMMSVRSLPLARHFALA